MLAALWILVRTCLLRVRSRSVRNVLGCWEARFEGGRGGGQLGVKDTKTIPDGAGEVVASGIHGGARDR
jgi:hypothetical protein